ncbi:hypothetical protein EJV47_18480 [Hymenobacter gummosus]|uniref:Uncharacterized protein n=1 Tax=Hymenobacter gummosus TaxID=1776032 RepID=A0A3S0J8H6_9BACT|nr:hypothetical protein [Hymenobacter gummosus]RTQ47903.1 hypothetical protein EJV47_18480 [Hymenobacter gummosus]
MPYLAAASNVLAPAYYALREQGFEVLYDAEQQWWTARKGKLEVLAYDPIELCGLVYILQCKGADWPVSDEAIEAFMALEQPRNLPKE